MIVCPLCGKELAESAESYICGGCGKVYRVNNGTPDLAASQEEGQGGFKEEFFDEFHEKERTNFWHNGRKNIIYNLIRKYSKPGGRLIELGCGSGNIIEFLNRRGIPIEGGDIFQKAIEYAKKKFPAKFYRLDLNELPFREEFDAIGLFDALEHIEDDSKALRNIRRGLKKDGLLYITVPAGKNLWSNYDEFYCHKRRYDKSELEAKLGEAGFEVVKMSFYVFFLYPAVYLTRKHSARYKNSKAELNKSDAVDAPPVINSVLSAIMMIEALIIRYVNLPIGSSLIAVAKKIPEFEK
ncbi:MAG: class I SAM-dependent methyltransferase [bacterium]